MSDVWVVNVVLKVTWALPRGSIGQVKVCTENDQLFWKLSDNRVLGQRYVADVQALAECRCML